MTFSSLIKTITTAFIICLAVPAVVLFYFYRLGTIGIQIEQNYNPPSVGIEIIERYKTAYAYCTVPDTFPCMFHFSK